MVSISEVNDQIRQSVPLLPLPHRLILTPTVEQLPEEIFERLLLQVKSFGGFDENNDPHKEHDFGKVTADGCCYFWKFDYYDNDFRYFQKNGTRVLTIMRVDEY